jgi:hypothetical protein
VTARGVSACRIEYSKNSVLGAIFTTALEDGVIVVHPSHRPARWQRTSKFRPGRRGIQALTHARSETILGLAGLAAATALAAVGGRGGGIATALAIGLAVQAITYLTAPPVTLAADRSLARAAGNLLDIPAVAIAVGLGQPAPPVPPRRPRSTSAHTRTLQPAGRSDARRQAHHAHALPQSPPGPGPGRDFVTGRHHRRPPGRPDPGRHPGLDAGRLPLA